MRRRVLTRIHTDAEQTARKMGDRAQLHRSPILWPPLPASSRGKDRGTLAELVPVVKAQLRVLIESVDDKRVEIVVFDSVVLQWLREKLLLDVLTDYRHESRRLRARRHRQRGNVVWRRDGDGLDDIAVSESHIVGALA